jgi:TetR/AcrR family transcriptional regulator, transcriptional repressor for nem operon
MRYQKGRKDASRRRIMEVAAEHFRSDGIAASGLSGIMNDVGLTNGAFYPHFQSKAELVRECVAEALQDQSRRVQETLTVGGVEAVLAAYLSPEHRDQPRSGCVSAALLPELARESPETRRLYAERLLNIVRQMASSLSPQIPDREGATLGVYATLIGTLQLARAVRGTALSDRILAAGAEAARTLIGPGTTAKKEKSAMQKSSARAVTDRRHAPARKTAGKAP